MIKCLIVFCMFCTCSLFANSIQLFNDSEYTLKAVIYNAGGTILGEFVLNPRDASEWSDNDQNFGTESQDASQSPYTVNWLCMSGSPWGSCDNVAAGSLVTAQGCGGLQECGGNNPNAPSQGAP